MHNLKVGLIYLNTVKSVGINLDYRCVSRIAIEAIGEKHDVRSALRRHWRERKAEVHKELRLL